MLTRIVLTIVAMTLALGSVPAAASEADKAAIRQLIKDYGESRAKGKEAMRALYTQDAVYFPRSGEEKFGNDAVIEAHFPPPAPNRPQPGSTERRKIVTDGVDADGKFGFAYGRLCSEADGGKLNCILRWLIVVRKDDDGRWRMVADIDNTPKQPLQ